MPVIAAIHGNCFGAGLQLALGADIRIATPGREASPSWRRNGAWYPTWAGPRSCASCVGIDVAKELAMTGRVLSGAEAQRSGSSPT